MLFTVSRASLLDALGHVHGIAERRTTIPILANVLIEARADGVKLIATDLEIAATESLKATVTRDGSVTAPASTLYDIVRRLPEAAEVVLEHKGGDESLTLKAGRYSTHLLTLPVEDFPSMTTGSMPHNFQVPALVLRGMIDRVRFAISTEDTRYNLNGIYLHVAQTDGGAVLRAVATDGRRLALVDEALPAGAADMPGVIVPRRSVTELRKMLDKATGNIDVGLPETRIRFGIGDVALISKLIDGTFPEYDRVIPKTNDKILRVGKKEFADAVGRVAAISDERSRPVKLAAADGGLTITAEDTGRGAAREEIAGDGVEYTAAPVEIGFQARYLNDVCDQIASRVEFRISDGVAPALVADADDSSALFVLMPMRA